MPRILVVEDDRSIQQLLAEALSAEGYDVECERDGSCAVAAFERSPADGVVLDVLLPGMNGFEVAERIRGTPQGQRVPIVMLSGIFRGSKHHDAASSRFGVITYVDKPFRIEEVVAPLRAALGPGRPAAQRRSAPSVPSPAPAPATPRPAAPAAVSLKGNLRERPLVWILGELLRRRVGGALLLRRGRVRKVIYLRNGAPIAVRSNVPSERLGAILLRDRLVRPEDLEEAMRRAAATREPLGLALVGLGALSPALLESALRRQLQARLYDLFGWTEGECVFRVRERYPRRLSAVDLPPARLLYEGLRSGMPAPMQGNELAPRLRVRPIPWPEAMRALAPQFPDAERAVLAGLDGHETIGEIVARRPVPDVGALLLAAMCTGMIVPAAARPAEPARAAEPARPAPSGEPSRRATQPPAAPSVPGAEAPARQPHKASEVVKLAELQAQLARIEGKDHWEVLGVDRQADASRIRSAYVALAKQYHPDRFTIAEPEARKIADRIFTLVSTAYQVLSDPERRRAYEAELTVGREAAQASEKLARVVAAEKAFVRGQGALQRRQYAEAREHFAEAVRLYDAEAEYHAFLGYASLLAGEGDAGAVAVAQREIARAKQLDPRSDKAYLFQGYVHKQLGQPEKAAAEFRRAVDLNPQNIEAARELRLMAMRAEKGGGRGGKR